MFHFTSQIVAYEVNATKFFDKNRQWKISMINHIGSPMSDINISLDSYHSYKLSKNERAQKSGRWMSPHIRTKDERSFAPLFFSSISVAYLKGATVFLIYHINRGPEQSKNTEIFTHFLISKEIYYCNLKRLWWPTVWMGSMKTAIPRERKVAIFVMGRLQNHLSLMCIQIINSIRVAWNAGEKS